MIRVINNSIYLTRGDSASIQLKITQVDDDTDYTPEDGDVITFSLKKDPTQSKTLLSKTLSNETLVINPEDTNNLAYGRYVYDIQLTKKDGTVQTIIPPHIFKLDKEVTF
nr:MAG TPA: hypothetical protein [Caudoviricetes sp.]